MSQPPGPTYPEPQYPGADTAPPQYPSAAPSPAPQYPGSAPSPAPQYPEAAEPLHYPAPTPTAAHYPAPTPPAPQYPEAAAQTPQYAAAAPPPAPQYPQGATPYPHPATAAAPQQPAPVPHQPPADDLDYRHRGSRVHVAAHQRGADATAIGRLAIHVPGFLVSLAAVAAISQGIFGTVGGWLVVLAWLASGALVFHRPTELAYARRVLKLRPPLAEERARLEPVWREVTARAGVERHTYELMVESSTELNAMAAAGHVVGVTTYSLNRLSSSNLAAVLAHELGHHTGGHAWAGLLGYWYSLPGRMAWSVARGFARIALFIARRLSFAAYGILILFFGMLVTAGLLGAWFITIPLVIAPYLLAYVGRQAELRADQQAAALGFAQEMAEVLQRLQAEEDADKARAAAAGQKLNEPGTLAKLLDTHPDHATRLRALEPYRRLGR
ncbi:M48 family metalloprotease [Streptomyces sp. NPDC019890]|uniref:M48 family metalloprotease n=1 Tax=Streptomyces sp. NPDC019890 TaxID=3365064 RepID=UPI00384C91BA